MVGPSSVDGAVSIEAEPDSAEGAASTLRNRLGSPATALNAPCASAGIQMQCVFS